MAVMKSDYVNGIVTHTVTADAIDNPRFSSDGYQVRLSFRNLASQAMTGYVHEDDLDDKSKYWKTPELIQQLKKLRSHYDKQRDSYMQSISALGLAQKYKFKADAISEIIVDLESGNGIWED